MGNITSVTFSLFNSNLSYTPSPVVLVATAISSFLILAGTFYTLRKSGSKSQIPALGGLSIVNSWNFFVGRRDFLQSNFKKLGQPIFSFKLLQYQIVALSGENARRVFFTEKSLNISEGYALLTGRAPTLNDRNRKSFQEEYSNDGVTKLNKSIHYVLSRDRLQEILPTLFNDIIKRMDGWGDSGKINPFNDVYSFIFQMTVRMATCRELAEDEVAVDRLFGLFWKLEKTATPVGLLLPWLPSKAIRDKKQATADMYNTVFGYIASRRSARESGSDAIDLLIAQGDDNVTIVEFVLKVIFAGVINTGITSCWALLYLSSSTDWKQKAIAEIHQFINTHTNTASSEPLHRRLSTIPISAWDDEMPILESIIRESIRLAVNVPLLRRNVVDDLPLLDKTVDRGAFMTYDIGDAHLNPNIYSEPEVFDPNRFAAPREEGKNTYGAFLGWGAGRHPCAGTKVAKLEIKMILVLMLVGYEYTIVDAAGKPPKQSPSPNRKDVPLIRPIGEACFLQYKKVID